MRLVLLLLSLSACLSVWAAPPGSDSISAAAVEFTGSAPHAQAGWKIRFTDRLKEKYGENSKLISAVLAFPVFGIVGLHRIYLGTKPYVPVVYIATLGGCAGILPLVDFFAILTANQETFESFRNNPRVFMWAK
jgi:hypothetical protein